MALMMSDFVMGYDALFWNQVSFFQKTFQALTSDSKVLEREEILELLKVHDVGFHPEQHLEQLHEADINKTDL